MPAKKTTGKAPGPQKPGSAKPGNARPKNATSGNETPDERFAMLCRAVLELRDEDEVRRFLVDLCTPGEMKDFGERFYIARLLHERGAGRNTLSYRDISAMTGASTTTVGRVARFLEQEPHHGYKTVLERMKP